MEAAKAAPRPATFDRRDLSGIWYGRGNSLLMGNPVPPFTPQGQEMYNANKPSYGPRAVMPAFGNDPHGRCDPLGYPGNLWRNNRSFEIIQTPGKMIQTFEWGHAFREVWTDNKKIPEYPDPRWYGWAVARWEGDTFVIDSTGYNPKTWIDQLGYPHSEEMRLQERWRRVDYETLEITMTLTDPVTYTKPWVSAKPMIYKLQLPKDLTVLEEVFCVPSEEQSFNEAIRNPAGAGVSRLPE
jgi:hypothetical protein